MNSKEKLDKLNEDLDLYLENKGIPSPAIESHLSLNSQELLALSAEELFTVAYEIQAYSYLIQNLSNEKQTIVEACKKKIQNYVGTKLHEYPIFGNAEKLRYAIEDHDSASQLDKLAEGPSLIVTRLASLSYRLETLSRVCNELAKTKRKDNYNA